MPVSRYKRHVQSNLSRYVLVYYTGDREEVGFTCSFVPITIIIRNAGGLETGWYLVRKHPTRPVLLTRPEDMERVTPQKMRELVRRMKIRFTKLARAMYRDNRIRVYYTKDLPHILTSLDRWFGYVLLRSHSLVFDKLSLYEIVALKLRNIPDKDKSIVSTWGGVTIIFRLHR